jgi:hypothetical protein
VLQPFVESWPPLQFRNPFYADCRTPWTSDQPVTRPLPTQRTTQRQNARTDRHPCLEWDSNPRPQRAKTVYALGRAATVIGILRGIWRLTPLKNNLFQHIVTYSTIAASDESIAESVLELQQLFRCIVFSYLRIIKSIASRRYFKFQEQNRSHRGLCPIRRDLAHL